MIIYRPQSGYGNNDYMLRKNVGLWDEALSRDCPMKFLSQKMSATYLVDIMRSPDNPKDLEIFALPSCDKLLLDALAVKETELNALYELAKQTFPGRAAFTIDMKDMRLITLEDFVSLSPPTSGEYAVFTFDCEPKIGGFPFLYTLPMANCSGIYKDLFRIQSLSSLWMPKCAGFPTTVGKEFTYVMLKSFINGAFNMDKPTTDDARFPTNGMAEMPSYYKTSALDDLLNQAGVDSVVMSKKGTKLLPEPAKTTKSPTYRELADKTDEEVQASASIALREQMLSDLKNKAMVQLSDICMYGLPAALKLLNVDLEIIHVNVNVAVAAKSMYIYDGILYIIPKEGSTVDWAEFFGTDSLVLEVDETIFSHKDNEFLQ